MAIRTEDNVSKPAQEVASNMEKAVRTNDKQGYENAMNEVNKYRDTHTPDEAKAYTAALTKRLQDDKVLPTVALFELQRDFKKIDTGENERLERGELDNFAHRNDVNDLQRNLIQNVQENYDQIRNINRWGETMFGLNSDAISLKDVNEGVKEQQAQLNLYAPDKQGKSLVEKLVDKNGNIPGGTIKELLNLEAKHPGQYLSPEDKKTLEDIQSKRSWFSRLPFTDDVSKERLEKMATSSATTQQQLEQQPRNSRVDTPAAPTERPSPEKQEMARQYQVEQQEAARKEHEQAVAKEQAQKALQDALTIHKKNESYAHAAERLLALAGNTDPTGQEIKNLSHQLWVANGRKKAGGVSVGDELQLDDSIKHNEALKKLFQAQS